MNPRLVRCLLAAIPVGFAAAGWGLYAGWHPLLAPLIYSVAGSAAFVLFALVAAPLRDWTPKPRPRLDDLLQPQST